MGFNSFSWRSLSTRVTVFSLVIFLVAIWTLAFYANWSLRRDFARVLGEQQVSTVSRIASELDCPEAKCPEHQAIWVHGD